MTGTTKGWQLSGPALGFAAASSLAGCGASARPPSADVSVDAPGVVDFSCTDDGAELSGRYVSTSADGFRVVLVDQPSAAEGDTSYTYTFRGAVVGGGVLSKTPETVTFQQPPGVFELACRHDDRSGTPVRLHVVDNDYNYREPQRPTAYGCRPGGALYPTIHHGGTAAKAVQAAIDWEADGYTYRVHQLDGGYWRVPGYGFELDRDDDAWALGSVYKDESGRWTASLSSVCE